MNQQRIADSIMKMYSEVRSYDVHYSTIRTSVATFFIGLSLSLGAFLIQRKSYGLAILFPTGLLFMATFLTGYFQRLIFFCVLMERRLEDLLTRTLQEGYVPDVEELDSLKFRGTWEALDRRRRFPKYQWKEAGNLLLILCTGLYIVASVWIRSTWPGTATIDPGTGTYDGFSPKGPTVAAPIDPVAGALTEIHALLRERVPDPETQREFLEALKDSSQRPLPPRPKPTVPVGTLVMFGVAGAAFLVGGVVLMVAGTGRWKAVGTGLTLLGTLTMGGVTILSISELNLFINTSGGAGFQMESIGTIYPFPTAGHEPDDPVLNTRLKAVVSAASQRFSRNELKCLMLVGRTDKRELLPEPRRMYGSNDGLAEARARWVKDRLSAELGGLHSIVLTSGPMNIGVQVSPDKMASDRSVEVYMCGEKNK